MDESIKITNVFKSIEKAITVKDTIKINNYLKSIDLIEQSFLESYPERKKQGVYYTNQDISEFIINEAEGIIRKLMRENPVLFEKIKNNIKYFV